MNTSRARISCDCHLYIFHENVGTRGDGHLILGIGQDLISEGEHIQSEESIIKGDSLKSFIREALKIHTSIELHS